MAKNPFQFLFKPISDNVVIDRIEIQTKQEKSFKKSGLVLPEGAVSPKNIMDIEKQRADEIATYDTAADKLMRVWEDHPNQGIVMAVGPGRSLGEGDRIPIDLKPGDKIFYRGRAGEPLIYNGKLYWVVKEHEIYGTVPK